LPPAGGGGARSDVKRPYVEDPPSRINKPRLALGEKIGKFFEAFGKNAPDGGGVLISLDSAGSLCGTLMEIKSAKYTLVSDQQETGDLATLRAKVRVDRCVLLIAVDIGGHFLKAVHVVQST
jgi:hypothetical protein